MKIFFDLQRGGYFTRYAEVLKILSERGHELHLTFRSERDLEDVRERVAALPGPADTATLRVKRSDVWDALADELRRTADYARYLDRRLEAGYLRRRQDHLPRLLRPLRSIQGLSPRASRVLLRVLYALEEALPSARAVEREITAVGPDVVLVTPLVKGLEQTDLLKSARRLGIPSGAAIASWDHLTTKGLLRARPDRLLVWNEAQRREAVDLHLMPEDRVSMTGAQTFDHWFTRAPSTSRAEFCAEAGLDPDRPFVVFAGSSFSITPPDLEHDFVLRWIGELRRSSEPTLRDLGVLVRPHPDNAGHWRNEDLQAFGGAVLWPRPDRLHQRTGGKLVRTENDKSQYFDSIHHSSGIVGINTSAMIEAAIIGRPVLTMQPPEFADGQGATVHFRYLLPENGGFVLRAEGLDEHMVQLRRTVEAPSDPNSATKEFVRSFVRPHGLEAPATPRVADLVEELGGEHVRSEARSNRLVLLRGALWPFAVGVKYGRPSAASTAMRRTLRTRWKGLRKPARRLWKRRHALGALALRARARRSPTAPPAPYFERPIDQGADSPTASPLDAVRK